MLPLFMSHLRTCPSKSNTSRLRFTHLAQHFLLSVNSVVPLCLTSLPSAGRRCGCSLASHPRRQESGRPGGRGIRAAGQQDGRQQWLEVVALVKVDWRRKTLRSLSSDGRTMVLSAAHRSRVRVRMAPVVIWTNAETSLRGVAPTRRSQCGGSPEGIVWHRLSIMPTDAVRCHMKKGWSLYSPASWVKLIFFSLEGFFSPRLPKGGGLSSSVSC